MSILERAERQRDWLKRVEEEENRRLDVEMDFLKEIGGKLEERGMRMIPAHGEGFHACVLMCGDKELTDPISLFALAHELGVHFPDHWVPPPGESRDSAEDDFASL